MYTNTMLQTPKYTSKKKRPYRKTLTVLAVIFSLYAVTLIFPFLWLIVNSLKTKYEFNMHPWDFPSAPFAQFANYGKIFSEFNLGSMFLNSIILSILMPAITVFCCSCVGYAYATHEFKLKRVLYWVALLPMIVSVAGTLPAQYNLIVNLGFYDNIPGMLLTATNGFGFNFLVMASVYQNISPHYRESAEIDGAGKWRIYLQIYMPQALTVLVSIWLLGFIGTWNDYMTPYLFLPSHQTLSVGIYYISQQVSIGNSQFSGDYPKLFAAMILSILPVLVLFACFQDKVMNLTVGGGIKG